MARLRPNSLEVIAQADKTLDSKATIEFLKLIEENNIEADKIVFFVDNARYYYNGDVIEYVTSSKQLEMVFLPPYAPNLNLIERLWKFMKRKTLYNRYYPSFKDFKEALGNFFMRLPQHYDELASIITDEFQVVGI
jgi:transposase